RNEKLILAIGTLAKGRRGAAVDRPPGTCDKLGRKRPVPAFALVSTTNAAHVQISVRYVRREVLFGSRILAEKITCADKIAVLEIARPTQVVEPARLPVQWQAAIAPGKWVCGTLENEGVDRVPVGPIDVHFKVPLRTGPVRDARRDNLRKIDPKRGIGHRIDERGSIKMGRAAIVQAGRAAIIHSQRDFFGRSPKHADVIAQVPIVSAKAELIGWRQTDPLSQFRIRVVDGRADSDREARMHLPGYGRLDGDIGQPAFD